jgi:hypothetical protein
VPEATVRYALEVPLVTVETASDNGGIVLATHRAFSGRVGRLAGRRASEEFPAAEQPFVFLVGVGRAGRTGRSELGGDGRGKSGGEKRPRPPGAGAMSIREH